MGTRRLPHLSDPTPDPLLPRFYTANQLHALYEKIKNETRGDILVKLGEEPTWTEGGWTAMQLKRTREHFLKEAFRQDYPEIYEHYVEWRPYAVLAVNGPQELLSDPACPKCGLFLAGWTMPVDELQRRRYAA
jgi:hypothetical protein